MRVDTSGIDQSNLSIFSQDWWLRIVSGSPDYREVRVVLGNVVVGRLPFILSRSKTGFVRCFNPYWSRLAGPIVDPGLSREQQTQVICALLQQLPHWASFGFVCNSNLAYADIVRSAFREAGFEHSTQVTYVRSPFGDVLDTRKAKHRGHLKRAAKELHCVDISAKEFVQFYKTNLNAQKKRSYSPLEILTCLIEEATARGQARAIAAMPNSENRSGARDGLAPYDAAIVYLWDNDRCYYWLSTRREPLAGDTLAKPHPDATKFLAVKAMEDAQAMNLVFDADGVTSPGTENFYRNMFGLREVQRRDVFQRVTILERLRLRYRQQFKTLFAN